MNIDFSEFWSELPNIVNELVSKEFCGRGEDRNLAPGSDPLPQICNETAIIAYVQKIR